MSDTNDPKINPDDFTHLDVTTFGPGLARPPRLMDTDPPRPPRGNAKPVEYSPEDLAKFGEAQARLRERVRAGRLVRRGRRGDASESKPSGRQRKGGGR